MNCEQAGERLSALADGELSGAAAWSLRRHAPRCARCAAALAALQETRAALRRHAAAPMAGVGGHSPGAPPEFWAAVERRLDAVDAHRARGRRMGRPAVGWAVVAALLAVLGALAAFLAARRPPVTPAWVVAQHTRSLSLGQPQPPVGSSQSSRLLSASPDDAAAWLNRRLGHRVPPVDLELVGLELRGALTTEEQGRPAALLRYQRGPERWSLLVVPGGGELVGGRETTDGRQQFQIGGAGGLRLAAWRSQGSLFVLIGPAPEGELLRVARQAARACEIAR